MGKGRCLLQSYTSVLRGKRLSFAHLLARGSLAERHYIDISYHHPHDDSDYFTYGSVKGER